MLITLKRIQYGRSQYCTLKISVDNTYHSVLFHNDEDNLDKLVFSFILCTFSIQSHVTCMYVCHCIIQRIPVKTIVIFSRNVTQIEV